MELALFIHIKIKSVFEEKLCKTSIENKQLKIKTKNVYKCSIHFHKYIKTNI